MMKKRMVAAVVSVATFMAVTVAFAAWSRGSYPATTASGDSVTFDVAAPNSEGEHTVTPAGTIGGSPIRKADPMVDDSTTDGGGNPHPPHKIGDHETCATRNWLVTLENGDKYVVYFSACQSTLGPPLGHTIGSVEPHPSGTPAQPLVE